MNKIPIALIKIYRFFSKTVIGNGLVPLVAPSVCRFYPTCSEYSMLAFNKYGFWKGLYKSAGRIIRCNPFSAAGPDLP